MKCVRRFRARSLSISVHKGLKIQDMSSGVHGALHDTSSQGPEAFDRFSQGALCIERPPLHIVEPAYNQKWRAFKEAEKASDEIRLYGYMTVPEAWELRTKNCLSLEDELVPSLKLFNDRAVN